MDLKLDLSAATEAELRAQAEASGLGVEAYVEQLIRENTPRRKLTPAEAAAKAEAFERWARSHKPRPPLPPEAFTRENLVREGG